VGGVCGWVCVWCGCVWCVCGCGCVWVCVWCVCGVCVWVGVCGWVLVSGLDWSCATTTVHSVCVSLGGKVLATNSPAIYLAIALYTYFPSTLIRFVIPVVFVINYIGVCVPV